MVVPLLASKARQVKRGVKEVVKGIRKGEKGCVFLRAHQGLPDNRYFT